MKIVAKRIARLESSIIYDGPTRTLAARVRAGVYKAFRPRGRGLRAIIKQAPRKKLRALGGLRGSIAAMPSLGLRRLLQELNGMW